MFRASMLFLASALMLTPAAAQNRPLETILVEEFLKLPENFQVLYVAGILDGMSFVSYGNNDPTLGAWTNCVRQKTLGETNREVVAWLETNPEYRTSPVPWTVAQAIGARDCPR